MLSDSGYIDRAHYIIAIAIKTGNTPDKNIFTGMAIKRLITKFSISERMAKSDVSLIVSVWRTEKWKTHVSHNPYLTDEEKTAWIASH